MEDNYVQLLDDIEKASEEESRKKRCLQNLESQIADQGEKQLRAEKCLHKVQKNIQNMDVCSEENLFSIQEVKNHICRALSLSKVLLSLQTM